MHDREEAGTAQHGALRRRRQHTLSLHPRHVRKYSIGELIGVLEFAAHELEGLTKSETAEAPQSPDGQGRAGGHLKRSSSGDAKFANFGVIDAFWRLDPEAIEHCGIG